jgi:hypothetical protein
VALFKAEVEQAFEIIERLGLEDVHDLRGS